MKDPSFDIIEMKETIDIISYLTEIPPINYEELEFVKYISKGSFGVTEERRYRGTKVALKLLLDNSLHSTNEFLREAKLLHQCQHPEYVVELIGICRNQKGLVMELMECGLDQYLKGWVNFLNHFTWDIRASIALKIIKAINHLHNLGVVHLDIKSLNFLYSKDFIKIADFGQCRLIVDEWDPKAYMKAMLPLGEVGTVAWMAPEVANQRVQLAHIKKVDIYSFGAIMSELDSLGYPNGDTSPRVFRKKVSSREIKHKFSKNAPFWFRNIAEKCLRYEPEHRPTAPEVVDMLIKAIHDNFHQNKRFQN
ncbi:kinase [Thraustotheca clavata]|uniref:Kinase n=1 Tax=Thraustotheca clavata TaxID=74557 RepID=A0A1W0AAQ9_9STRA|nr:kinase [Thraustotheca clavata]